MGYRAAAECRRIGQFLRVALVFLIAMGGWAPAQEEDPNAYRLKKGDSVSLSVFQEPDLTASVSLTNSGEASFPLIGAVQVAGLSLKEAEKLVTELYDRDYLVNPRVSLNLVAAAEETVSVLGAVARPGTVTIPLGSSLDLRTALASVGGPTTEADKNRIRMRRGERTVVFTYDELQSKGGDVPLRAGDIITVEGSRFAGQVVTIAGEVSRPGDIPFPLGGNFDILAAIAGAGGTAENANRTRVTIKGSGGIRTVDLDALERPGAARVNLRPGDLITVAPSPFAGKFVTITGFVKSPGQVEFPLNGKLDVATAVALAGGLDRLGNGRKVLVKRFVGDRVQTIRVDMEKEKRGAGQPTMLRPGDTLDVPERFF